MTDNADDAAPAEAASSHHGRLRRAITWSGLAARRVRTRALTTAPGRIGAAVAGVAIAVALLLVVSGLSLGMVAPATGVGGAEYWIVPDSDADSPLVDTGDPQFGAVHPTADRIRATDGVDAATPVLTTVIPVETHDGERERLMAVGLHPEADIDVYGFSPAAAAGTDGEGAVLSDGAASLLAVDEGDGLVVDDRELSVASVETGAGLADASPIVLMELSTLQAITGADETDAADRFIVRADEDGAAELEGLYEDGTVRSSDELVADRLFEAELPLALSLAALLVALVVGTTFVAVATAMDVAADREELATLAAIGVARRRRIGLYAGQSLLVATAGGAVGVGLGLASIEAANVAASGLVSIEGPIERHPLFVGYGFAAAWAIGLLSIPAVAATVRRVEGGGGLGG